MVCKKKIIEQVEINRCDITDACSGGSMSMTSCGPLMKNKLCMVRDDSNGCVIKKEISNNVQPKLKNYVSVRNFIKFKWDTHVQDVTWVKGTVS